MLVVYDSNTPPSALAAEMYTVTAVDGGVIDLTGNPVTGTVATATFPDFSAEVPAGYVPGWFVVAVTPNGTLVRAGSDTGAGGTPFIDFPFADRSVFVALAKNSSNTIGGFFVRASGTPTIALPNPIDPSASGSPVSVTDLAASANLLVYTLNVSWGTPVVVNATISKAYLGSATGYTLPDLTALNGFGDTLPQSGDTVNVTVSAVESSLTLEEMANQEGTDLFLLPDGTNVTFAEKRLNYVLP